MFTKNRPEIVSKTLPQLTNADLSVIVLDDSTNTETKRIVDNIAKKGNNIYYHGRYEQKELLQKFTKLGSDLETFIKPLGTNGWTLGCVRNYAIILAKTQEFERVLFMDDDIIIKDCNIIQKMMRLLDKADFVGAKIGRMPDDSVVGHIMRELGMSPYEFLSGGFLAFNLNSVSEYFLNYYNEDWIWLFLHKSKAKLVEHGEVYQLPFNPFENGVERALEQEFGEILVEGVKEASRNDKFSLLMEEIFWECILEESVINIKKILSLYKGKNIENIAMPVCSALLEYHTIVAPNSFTKVFNEYFDKKKNWLTILNWRDENV